MVGVVDLDAVNWYLGAQFIKQVNIIKREALFAAAGMSYQANSPTAVRCLHGFLHISHNGAETRLAYYLHRGLPVGNISMFT